MSLLQPLAFWTPSPFELIVIMVVALLLFGKRLPEVARSLGKGVVEFKKGLKGVEEDIEQSDYQAPPKREQLYSGDSSQQEGTSHPTASPAEDDRSKT